MATTSSYTLSDQIFQRVMKRRFHLHLELSTCDWISQDSFEYTGQTEPVIQSCENMHSQHT